MILTDHRISSVIPGLYALRSHRRLAAYDELGGPTNTKLYGFVDAESRTHLRPNRDSIISTLSGTNSPRRLSTSSFLSIRRFSGTVSPPEEVPLQEQQRTSVYNHERDTQFDEYVSSRHSNVHDSVDRAMRAEFGWGRSGSPASLGDDTGYKGILGSRPDMGRVPSSAGHSLDAVPESASEGGSVRRKADGSVGSGSSRAGTQKTRGSRGLEGLPEIRIEEGLGDLSELKIEKKRKTPTE